MSTPELQQILALLQKLGDNQDKLAAKVEELSKSKAASNGNLPALPTSALSSSRPPTLEPSPFPPSSLNGNGTAPTRSLADPVPFKPASPVFGSYGSPSSPRSGGVEALKAGRANSISSLSISPTNGTSTPYGNLSLAAAAVGAGAPGPLIPPDADPKDKRDGQYPSRIVLTTYPGQAGINPIYVDWGAGPTARERGPVVCSRIKSNLPIRNSIGAHAGSYSIYRALSIAMGQLRADWRPDLTNTHPPFVLPPRPGWFGDGTGRGEQGNKKDWKIVSFDPWGAMSQEVWAKEYAEGLDVRPTISQTKAHIKIQELDELFSKGEFPLDGDIVIKSPDLPAFPGVDQGVEVNTYKAAIDPVWYLPGVAARLGIDEMTLRRALFEDTGGMYPELLTRPDIKIFLPPIGGMTVYIVGDPAKLNDPDVEITCRPHDSCSGSDVFGSDICTCRPYLIFGIAEAIKCAQRGGVGIIVYFVKEGRSLGEVCKYMVYNRRKRGGDNAAEYFNSTEKVAGVKDARHQALMPDVFHWLGVKHITNLISMSNLKYDAIVGSGITVQNRYEIPDELIPADSRVEIDAKIQSGYFSHKQMNEEILRKTAGRGWEDIVH